MNLEAIAPSPSAVLKASEFLKNRALRTPVLTSPSANALTQAEIFFKCENLQKLGAFKYRGACFAISRLSEDVKGNGVVTFSSGNHAQAIALAASENGIPSVVVMSKSASKLKMEATRNCGAEVVLYDPLTEDREQVAAQIVQTRKMTLIPPYNHPDIIAGQGTAALELFQETGALDYLFVCVGGGGLIAGSALAAQNLSPQCKIIGVEPEVGNDGQRSFEKGEIIKIPIPKTIADGASTQSLGPIPFSIIKSYVNGMITVTDLELLKQMRFFIQHLKLIVEPTGCLAAAGVMSGKIALKGKRVGVIVSGGNVDPEVIASCLSLT